MNLSQVHHTCITIIYMMAIYSGQETNYVHRTLQQKILFIYVHHIITCKQNKINMLKCSLNLPPFLTRKDHQHIDDIDAPMIGII
uniref:Uncharacterized protein n=1 Tax=Pinctada fucata TaxID=50426 RepID=A0A194AMT5_PINFU